MSEVYLDSVRFGGKVLRPEILSLFYIKTTNFGGSITIEQFREDLLIMSNYLVN